MTFSIEEVISEPAAAKLGLTAAAATKGQLISECPFGVLNFPKLQRKNLAKNLKSGQINKIKALSYNTITYL